MPLSAQLGMAQLGLAQLGMVDAGTSFIPPVPPAIITIALASIRVIILPNWYEIEGFCPPCG